jgi:hypothetical protein
MGSECKNIADLFLTNVIKIEPFFPVRILDASIQSNRKFTVYCMFK